MMLLAVTPRGHYTASPDLAHYFQAMMWLDGVDA
jgi:hypothetical protein